MDLQYIKDKLSLLPMQPGCYLMKDKDGTVIYVGKAKKLKNRVSSYFVGSHNYKTTKGLHVCQHGSGFRLRGAHRAYAGDRERKAHDRTDRI